MVQSSLVQLEATCEKANKQAGIRDRGLNRQEQYKGKILQREEFAYRVGIYINQTIK